MSHRCIDPFMTPDGSVYSGGEQVADDSPILQTHGRHFVKVNQPAAAPETATANPGELRAVPVKSAAKKVAAKKPNPKGESE